MRVTALGNAPLMRCGLLPAFEQLGHNTSRFPLRNWWTMNAEEGVLRLEKDLETTGPDLLILAGYGPDYFLEIPRLCQKRGTGVIYWAIEDPIGFHKTLPLAQAADYVFTTTAECIPQYAEAGIKATLLTFACNPYYHKTGKYNPAYDVHLSLAASCYTWKTRKTGYEIILNSAKQSGYTLKVWGAGWDREPGRSILGDPGLYCGYFPNSQLPQLCASSSIILGVQCDASSVTQTSMRPYEVLACRGFHLTQWTKATTSIFSEGQHLVTARTKEEALEKIEFYMKRPQEREKIAGQGQQFVYRYHTYEQRVRETILPSLC